MIVRNEAKIIERCLRSVQAVIDYWVILDTGSTDETAKVIQRFFEHANIAGELHHGEFRDFAFSRNQALELCRGSKQLFDYILLIDADMELVVEDPQALRELGAAAYSLQQRNALIYSNIRVLRRDLDACYKGVTHEYLDTGTQARPINGLYMLDHACGANRKGKAERDARLLRGALEQEPDNLRYQFYLAQSLRDAGQVEQALPLYLARSAGGGWEEEAWYASYQAAVCLLALKDHDRFEETALASWQRRPWRAEPLLLLAQYFRNSGQYDQACHYAKQGRSLPLPEEDVLFVELSPYQWGFDQELAIAGFYAADKSHRALGKTCCEHLALAHTVPTYVRQQARQNLIWYASSASEKFGMTNARALCPPSPPGWASTNPSISRQGSHQAVIVRQVNYQIKNGQYNISEAGQVIRTRNVLMGFEPDGSICEPSEVALSPHLQVTERNDFAVRGHEDCRLFRWRRRWCATATLRERSQDGRCEIVLLELLGDGQIERESPLRGGWSHEHQKNWMPLVNNDELYLVYSLSPTRILKYDPEQGLARPWLHSETGIAGDHLRGGSQLVRIRHGLLDGWLGICHEVVVTPQESRRYLHRFFALDKDFQFTQLSTSFHFDRAEIEFCAGLALAEDGATLIASFGVNDGKAMLADLPLQSVLSQLIRLNPLWPKDHSED